MTQLNNTDCNESKSNAVSVAPHHALQYNPVYARLDSATINFLNEKILTVP
jgi:hypothetical protein